MKLRDNMLAAKKRNGSTLSSSSVRRELDMIRAMVSIAITDILNQGAGTSAIAKVTGLSRQAVLRIKADPVHAEVVLRAWEEKAAQRSS